MHNAALKKWALALTFWLALHLSSLRAQVFTNDLPLQAVTTGSNPVDFEFRSDGTLIAKGNSGVGSLGTGDQGNGMRMLWFPSVGAFRAGSIGTGYSIGSNPWDSANLGYDSVAFGYNTTAYASYSSAFGSGSSANGEYSMASGNSATANGITSAAFGAYTYATGPDAFATGILTAATSWNSTAMGSSTTASGPYSMATGGYTTASGAYSNSSGLSTIASGQYSSASGNTTVAQAQLSFVIGTYNVGGGSETSWVSGDPLFEIGNGTSETHADALVVYKNGNAILQGTLQIAPGGDIPMYTGE